MTYQEFLVHIVIEASSVAPPRLAELREAEAARAAELAATGNLQRLWRLPQGWSNIGLWSAQDQEALERLLDSLPLRPYMTIDVQPLHDHPSDPSERSGRRENGAPQ